MHNTWPLLTLTAAFALAPRAAAAEDLTVVYEVTSNGRTATATDYYTKAQFRSGNGANEVIFNVTDGRMTSINHARKEYSEMTIADLEAAIKAATAQMEAAMKNMPPEVREKMAGMTGGAGSVKVTKGAEGRKIAGYDTQQYLTTMSIGKTESWTTTAVTSPIEPGQMMRLLSLVGPTGTMFGNASEELQKVKGFPLASSTTMSLMGRTISSRREATSVKLGPVPDSAFAVPTGYKKVASPLKMTARPPK